MPTAIIKSGICGFTINATAECEEADHVVLKIESDCPNYRKVAEVLHEVDAFHELFGERYEGEIWKVCARHSPHASCPVPTGLLKLVEVAAGLALPQTVSVEIRRSAAP
jgi:hypothetical protein